MKFYVSSKAAKFFVEVIFLTTIVFLVKVESHIFSGEDQDSDSNSSFDSQSAYSGSQKSTSSSSWNIYKARPERPSKTDTHKIPVASEEWISEASLQISELLSPSTLSRADIFQYLLREISRASNRKKEDLKIELDSRLKTNKISESDMPYARALKSIIDAEIDLRQTIGFMVQIRDTRRRSIPSEVSSPPALSSYGLFSSDIFADPDAPFQLINKLIEIPKNEISKLIVLLQDYSKIFDDEDYAEFVFYRYKGYSESLILFLKGTRLDDLKRNMAEIERL